MESQSLVQEICPTTTQKWLSEGAILVDVREMDEVKRVDFDVSKILHIPLSEFEERFNEIPKTERLIMVCESGNRSLRAAAFLINHGYPDVVNMKFGMIRWLQRGFPAIGDLTVSDGISSCCS